MQVFRLKTFNLKGELAKLELDNKKTNKNNEDKVINGYGSYSFFTWRYESGSGYRAFLDVELLEDVAIGFSTTHGYQFNSNFYAGAGVSYVTHIGGSSPYVLTDFRFDNIVPGKNTPFMNVRFSLNKDFFVVRPTLGYRFNHLNLGLGYWFGNNGDNFFSFSVGIDLGGRKK